MLGPEKWRGGQLPEKDRKMTALDNVEVKEGVDQETVDAVKELSGAYKYGWETEIEMEFAPKGVNPDIVRLILSLIHI